MCASDNRENCGGENKKDVHQTTVLESLLLSLLVVRGTVSLLDLLSLSYSPLLGLGLPAILQALGRGTSASLESGPQLTAPGLAGVDPLLEVSAALFLHWGHPALDVGYGLV